MKRNYKRISNWLMSMAIVGLGFSSCGDKEEDGGDIPLMYGVVRPMYVVTGDVADADGKPVPAIEVSMEMQNPPTGVPVSVAKATSSSKGEYGMGIDPRNGNDKTAKFKVTFKDVDGAANGSFEDKVETVDVEVSKPLTLNVKLTPKK